MDGRDYCRAVRWGNLLLALASRINLSFGTHMSHDQIFIWAKTFAFWNGAFSSTALESSPFIRYIPHHPRGLCQPKDLVASESNLMLLLITFLWTECSDNKKGSTGNYGGEGSIADRRRWGEVPSLWLHSAPPMGL
jgi:hypothetical protein